MTAVTYPVLPLTDTELERVFHDDYGLADCECLGHDELHDPITGCGHQAAYRLTGKAIEEARRPNLCKLLCAACVDWQVDQLRLTRPTLLVTVRPI